MSEDAQQGAAQDGATEQSAEVQAAQQDVQDMQDIEADGVPQEVKDYVMNWVEDYVERRIAILVAKGQIQPAPSA